MEFIKAFDRKYPYNNKTEEAYARHLVLRNHAGLNHHWAYEAIRLKIGIADAKGRKNAWWTPDFLVITDHVELHEVKGFEKRDAMVAIRAARKQYPYFKFFLVKRVKKDWQIEEY